VAWNNLRMGRSYRRGATKLATFILVLMMWAWATGTAHVAGFWELGLVLMALSLAAFSAGMMWLGQVAIEPYVRRHWPDDLISWTRLQAARVRDFLVASHVLGGITANGLWGGRGRTPDRRHAVWTALAPIVIRHRSAGQRGVLGLGSALLNGGRPFRGDWVRPGGRAVPPAAPPHMDRRRGWRHGARWVRLGV
jgi:hypothetical protein